MWFIQVIFSPVKLGNVWNNLGLMWINWIQQMVVGIQKTIRILLVSILMVLVDYGAESVELPIQLVTTNKIVLSEDLKLWNTSTHGW